MTALPSEVEAIFRKYSTVSGRIRALADAGHSRSDIAKLVDRSYQQVRNVLVEYGRRGGNRPLSAASRPPDRIPTGVAETPAAYVPQAPAKVGPVLGWLDVEPEGVLRLPASVKQALGIGNGDKVLVEADGEGSVRLLSAHAAMLRAQEIVRPYLPKGVNVIDQFLADRRAEAAREREDD